MARRFLGTILGLTLAVGQSGALANPVLREEPADATTAELDLSAWRGRVILLDFWASWCVPCRDSFPWMAEMHDRYADRGLVVVAINLDEDAEPAARFLEGNDHGFHHVRDASGDLAEQFGLTAMPSSILFDREGRPVYRHVGFHRDKTSEYEQHILALLTGTADSGTLAVKTTPRRKLGARPWERGLLASPGMQLISDPLEIEFDDHVYFSREASSGGRGFGGGGCGCN